MRNEKGFFCSVSGLSNIPKEEIWFGPKTQEQPGMESQSFANIFTNGLKFFSTIEEAHAALEEIKRNRSISGADIGSIEIVIAETREDVEQLKQSGAVVVLNSIEGKTDIIGPNTSQDDKSTIYPIDGELLTVNGRVPFANYQAAEWTYAWSASRQGGKVSLAQIKKLSKVEQT